VTPPDPLTVPAVPDATAGGRYRWLVLGTVLVGLFTYGALTTILSASLKTVADDLGTATTTLAWAITGPFLALGIGNPIFGRVGDLRGRRRWFLAGLALFIVATFGAAAAPDAGWLIALRAVAGIGASMAVPNGSALVLENFAPEERARAMGWFMLVGTTAPAIGLVLGGPMIDAMGWRAVFAIYASIATVGLVAATVVIRHGDHARHSEGGIDVAGSLAVGVATLGAMLGLTLGSMRGFGDALALTLIALGPIGIAVFVAIERRVRSPLVPLRYFAVRAFSAPLLAYYAGHIAYMGGFVITPILLADVFGYSLGASTALLLLRPLSFGLASPLGSWAMDRVGARRTSIAGSAVLVASMALFAIGATTVRLDLVVVGLLTSGVAFGVVSPPFSVSIANAVDRGDLGVANGMLQTSASLGTVTGIQIALLALGDADRHVGDDFVVPFLIGGIGAAVMLVVVLSLRDRAPTSLEPASLAEHR
jgi:MFS family permease